MLENNKITGLTANEVAESRSKYGSNELTEKKGETILQKALGNLKDPIVSLLVFICVLSFILSIWGYVDIATPIGVLIAIILATFVSTFSEVKNEKIFESLKQSEKVGVKVYRDGAVLEINLTDVVVGDYIILQPGDSVPADGYLIQGKVSTDQSAINGESEDAMKLAVPNDINIVQLSQSTSTDNPHLLFKGTVVTNNEGIMKVTKVGDSTVYGSISQAVQEDNGVETPLKVKLNKLAKQISLMGYIGAIAIALEILIKGLIFDQVYIDGAGVIIQLIINAVTMALSIIVMAVPEGLPLLISLVCTLNMRKMFNENVLVRDTNAIETAGSLNILFSDKTGTITQNKFQVTSVLDAKGQSLTGADASMLYTNMFYNNEAKLTENGAVGSNSTDRALLNYVDQENLIDCEKDTENCIKFNSTIKYSAVTVEIANGDTITLLKGAPEVLLKLRGLNGADSVVIKNSISEMTTKAMRVLGFAHMEGSIENNKLPSTPIIFDGIVGIRDEIRTDAVEAIKELQGAGVQIAMVTGDCKETAVAIATEIGLMGEDRIALTSEEMASISDEEMKNILPKLAVVSRALPLDKQRLVRLGQELELVVGMTGDGVNDSPALKQADVGFAMGSGTSVAKAACGITILDDSLKSIAKAVSYGRTIYHNIQKFLIYQLTINVSAMLICLLGPALGLEEPLTVPQIIVVNIIMDTLAAIALGAEPVLESYMKERPKQRSQNILTNYIKSAVATSAVWITIVGTVMLMTSAFAISPAHLGTAYFTMFVLFSVFNGFNVRTEDCNIFKNLQENKPFLWVMSGIVLLQIILVYFGGNMFNCYGLNIIEWLECILAGFTIIIVDLLRKTCMKPDKVN